MRANAADLDAFAADYLTKSGTTTGRQLYEVLKPKFPGLTEDAFADLLQRLVSRDQIDLYDEPADSFRGFLGAWERNLWYYVSLVVCLSAALAAYTLPPNSPFLVLRWSLGLLFVLFLPGYVAMKALFPTREFDAFDRFAPSVGVSLVLDMISGLALNYTPWGIRLVPLLFLLGALTICLATLALVRQFEASRRGSRSLIPEQRRKGTEGVTKA